jgi:hypothetical protein
MDIGGTLNQRGPVAADAVTLGAVSLGAPADAPFPAAAEANRGSES